MNSCHALVQYAIYILYKALLYNIVIIECQAIAFNHHFTKINDY